MAKPGKDLGYYLRLPYAVQLTKRSDEGRQYWFAEILDLPGCMSHGASPEDAVRNIEEAKQLWIETQLGDGFEVPEPEDLAGYSGRVLVRMPKSLHRRLAHGARLDSVSLNQHIVTRLASQAWAERELREMRREVDTLSQQVRGANQISSVAIQVLKVLQFATKSPGDIPMDMPQRPEHAGTEVPKLPSGGMYVPDVFERFLGERELTPQA